MSARPWLPAAAARRPERLAIDGPAGRLTYAELEAQAALGARELAGRGVEKGDRVGLALPAGPTFVVALHACLRLGAAAMPVDLRLAAGERAVQQAGAAAVVQLPLDPVSPVPRQPPPAELPDAEDLAMVVYTSGTTSAARPVELTYANWEHSIRTSSARLGSHPDERWLCVLPLSHVGGLSILVRGAIHATTVVLHDGWDTERVARSLADEDVTAISLVPTTLARLLEAGARPGPALRCVLVGGAPLPGELAQRALDRGWPLAQTYGLTEACSQVATSPIGEPQTAGPPLEGTRVEIASDGEILVAGATVARGAVAPDGWLHTGDLGLLDAAGRLLVTGRSADTIVSGGENVSPAEVEAVLEAHPAVAEAAVLGRADPEWGEAVMATVVLRPGHGADAQQLRAHCAASLAPYKVPKAISFATELARTASGKLRRGAL